MPYYLRWHFPTHQPLPHLAFPLWQWPFNIRDKFCAVCHIHLYFPFTTRHLNRIRIYYHHAHPDPADNTNHEKTERRLYKHPRLHITSHVGGCLAVCDRPFITIWIWFASPSVFNLSPWWSRSNNSYKYSNPVPAHAGTRGVYLQLHPSVSSGGSKSAACEGRFML